MRYRRLLVTMTLLVLSVMGARGQDSIQPLIILKENNLWAWDGSAQLVPLTHQEPIPLSRLPLDNDLQRSPDGAWLVYTTQLTATEDLAQRMSTDVQPGNMWLWSPDGDSQPTQLTQQPEDVSLIEGRPERVIIRKTPFWSPDGTQVAWIERDNPNSACETQGTCDRIMIYNTIDQTTHMLAEGLPPLGSDVFKGTHGVWTENGFVFVSFLDALLEPRIRVYNPTTGQETLTIALPAPYDLYLPVIYQDQTWIGVMGETAWQLINLKTGQMMEAPGDPILVSTTHPEAGLQVCIAGWLPTGQLRYQAYTPQGWILDNRPIAQVAISPDGTAMAYQIYDETAQDLDPNIYIWDEPHYTTVPETDASLNQFTWGPAKWLIPEQAFDCLG